MNVNFNTFSIVARDPVTGFLGVAVSTKVPAVGSLCPFVRPGIGATSIQAWVDPSLGPLVLNQLSTGLVAASALDRVMATAVDRDFRQVGVVDWHGGSAAFTGDCTDIW